MLIIIAGTSCMLLAFSSMWLSWYVLMPHKRIHLADGTDTLGEVVGGKVGEIMHEEMDAVMHSHKTSKK